MQQTNLGELTVSVSYAVNRYPGAARRPVR